MFEKEENKLLKLDKESSIYEQRKHLSFEFENNDFLKKDILSRDKKGLINTFLKGLLTKYSHAAVIMELMEQLSLQEIVSCFGDKEWSENRKGEVKTVATYYRRMYNGGVERVLANLLFLWTEMGYKVVLYTDEEPNEGDYHYPESIKRIVLPGPGQVQKRLFFLEKSLEEENIDLFISHGWMSPIVLQEVLLTKTMNIPFVLYTHGHFTALYEGCTESAMISHKVFPLCDVIVSLADINTKFYQMCGCNSYLIQNPIPTELQVVTQTASLNSHRILWIGRIADGKRFKDAFYVLKRVKESIFDAELDVVGTWDRPEIIDEMKEFCQKEGLTDCVHFHGYQTEVSFFYKEAGVMLMTSEKEGYPLVLLESKAYGVPCVMYELPYLTMVKDGKGILTASVGNVDLLAEHIIGMFNDDNRRILLGIEARESFEHLLQYDLTENWKRIFKVASEEPNLEDEDSKLQSTSDTESLMLTMLMDQICEGVRMRCNSSLDYIVGEKLLNIPRKIFHMSKTLIQRMKKG